MSMGYSGLSPPPPTTPLPFSSLKPTKFGFIYIGLNSLNQALGLEAVNHVTCEPSELGLRLMFKDGF